MANVVSKYVPGTQGSTRPVLFGYIGVGLIGIEGFLQKLRNVRIESAAR
jgi:hypothetical protein